MTGDPETPQAKTMHTLAGGSDFPTTRWTLVIAAADPRRTRGSLRSGFAVRGLLVSVIRLCSPPRLSG